MPLDLVLHLSARCQHGNHPNPTDVTAESEHSDTRLLRRNICLHQHLLIAKEIRTPRRLTTIKVLEIKRRETSMLHIGFVLQLNHLASEGRCSSAPHATSSEIGAKTYYLTPVKYKYKVLVQVQLFRTFCN